MSDQKRPYRMTRRAELEEQTRRRITESTVALHEELGPARTSISAIAERAGVRRSTVYRHFPDEEALFAACSSHWRAANPPPDPRAWAAIERPGRAHRDRAPRALRVLRAAPSRCTTSLLRDEPRRPGRRSACSATSTATCGAIQDVLMAGRGLRGRAARRTRAAIGHALAFPTWRSLTPRAGAGRRRRRRADVPARRRTRPAPDELAATGSVDSATRQEGQVMGEIHVHEFMSLDGVIDAPTWTFDYGFDPKMGEAIGAFTARCPGILLGRTTYEMFEPAWSTRTVEDDPGAPFFNDTTKYVVSATLTDATWRNSKIVGAVRRRRDPPPQGRGRRRPLRQRQRHAGAGDARRRPRRRAPPVRLSADPRRRPAAVPGGRRARQAVARGLRVRTRTASST